MRLTQSASLFFLINPNPVKLCLIDMGRINDQAFGSSISNALIQQQTERTVESPLAI